MQNVYSVYGSRIHILLEDSVADTYNRAMDAYFAAQEAHKKIHGKPWNPVEDPLAILWNEEEQRVFNKVAELMNLMVEINGGALHIPEEEMPSNHLLLVAPEKKRRRFHRG